MDQGVAHLADASYLRNLEELYLDDNLLRSDAARSLGQSQYLSKIEQLSLSHNKIKKEVQKNLMSNQCIELPKSFSNSQHSGLVK